MANAGLPVRSQNFKDKKGNVDWAALFNAQNEAAGLARRK
jgi:hypothetical protein